MKSNGNMRRSFIRMAVGILYGLGHDRIYLDDVGNWKRSPHECHKVFFIQADYDLKIYPRGISMRRLSICREESLAVGMVTIGDDDDDRIAGVLAPYIPVRAERATACRKLCAKHLFSPWWSSGWILPSSGNPSYFYETIQSFFGSQLKRNIEVPGQFSRIFLLAFAFLAEYCPTVSNLIRDSKWRISGNNFAR